jgi:hypothetical protein
VKNLHKVLESRKGRDHLEELGVDGNNRMDLREIGWKIVDWIRLERQWRALKHSNESSSSIKIKKCCWEVYMQVTW